MTDTPDRSSSETSSAYDAVVVVDDALTANAALAQLRRGVTLLWRGDFHNGRQLLKAVDRRLTPRTVRHFRTAAEAFAHQRTDRARRAGILNRIVVDIDVRPSSAGAQWVLDLRRAPEVSDPCTNAYGPAERGRRVPLTELQGVLGAWQWHERGVAVEALDGDRVYPDYGVFSPTRSEYVDLVDAVAASHLSPGARVIELGTGTGVLAVVLARRGAGNVVATDVNPRAVACARRNADLLGVGEKIDVVEADLWPAGAKNGAGADVVVFNPPWLPGKPTSDLEVGIYDVESDVLRRFLATLADNLNDDGEGWLVLSDLAEHLGLRSRAELEQWIADGGLQVLDRVDISPHHPKVDQAKVEHGKHHANPLQAARAQETVSLWRLGQQSANLMRR